jgi:pSer/pThr/pTyr-binding forkhead associated (FHA) protein
MYCTRCGHKNPDGASFCASCGNSLQPAEEQTMALAVGPADEEGPSLEELGPDQALLVIKGGPTAGSTVLVDKDITRLGRSPDSDVFLNDITVSRRHAEISREGRGFVIKDAGSLNGTYVNRERVDVAELASGDELQIGKFKIVFYTAPGPQ